MVNTMIDLSGRGFVAEYERLADEKDTIGCPGFDLTAEHVPPMVGDGRNIQIMWEYAKRLVEIAARHFPVIKPQKAYYEALGADGLWLLRKIVDYAHELGVLVILDAKRQDIGSTMRMYGIAVFDIDGVDACTTNTYLGPTFMPSKGCTGWMEWMEKGRIPICMGRTSNVEEAPELQDLVATLPERETIKGYERLLKPWDKLLGRPLKVFEWDVLLNMQLMHKVQELTGGVGSVASVIGATYPEEATLCRELVGDDMFFLVPGYKGPQGGTAVDAVRGLPKNGRRIITVNFSRGYSLEPWYDTKKQEARPGDPFDLIEETAIRNKAELAAARTEWIAMNAD